MSRLHRAVEKAEREGFMNFTRGSDGNGARPAALAEPPPATVKPHSFDVVCGEEPWDAAGPAAPAMSPMFVAAMEPGSAAAEQYRLLRTRLEGRDGTRPTQLLLVTSPRMGDGKTITSANLALTMAQEFRENVVLVETDLRRPMLAELFGVRPDPGLADVLLGASTLDEALVPVTGHHLLILPAGLAASRSTELLASSMMQRTVSALRARFSRIVFDTPPVALSDTHVLARLADGILVVVRAGVTPRPAIEKALAGFDRQRLIGIVLNEVDTDEADDYGYAYSSAAPDAGA